MTFAGVEIAEIATTAGLVTVLSGAVVWLLRARLAQHFASAADFQALNTSIREVGSRVQQVELRIGGMPNHAEMAHVSQRVAHLEGAVAGVQREVSVVAAEVRGLRDQLSSVERMLGMLVDHHIGEAKRP